MRPSASCSLEINVARPWLSGPLRSRERGRRGAHAGWARRLGGAAPPRGAHQKPSVRAIRVHFPYYNSISCPPPARPAPRASRLPGRGDERLASVPGGVRVRACLRVGARGGPRARGALARLGPV